MDNDKVFDKCSICGNHEALIFVKVVHQKNVMEKGLCAHCAIQYLEDKSNFDQFHIADKRVLEALDEMKNLLSMIVTNISKISSLMQKTPDPSSQNQLACSNCGLTYEDFRASGYLSCPDCYQTFREQIREILLEIERGLKHKGKMPKKYAELYMIKKEILYLRNQIKKSVHIENYEQADRLKKKLQKLLVQYPAGMDDELY